MKHTYESQGFSKKNMVEIRNIYTKLQKNVVFLKKIKKYVDIAMLIWYIDNAP
jgi:hypothetical protein